MGFHGLGRTRSSRCRQLQEGVGRRANGARRRRRGGFAAGSSADGGWNLGTLDLGSSLSVGPAPSRDGREGNSLQPSPGKLPTSSCLQPACSCARHAPWMESALQPVPVGNCARVTCTCLVHPTKHHCRRKYPQPSRLWRGARWPRRVAVRSTTYFSAPWQVRNTQTSIRVPYFAGAGGRPLDGVTGPSRFGPGARPRPRSASTPRHHPGLRRSWLALCHRRPSPSSSSSSSSSACMYRQNPPPPILALLPHHPSCVTISPSPRVLAAARSTARPD